MLKNNEKFATGEFYHIYNRGVDKRDIFSDEVDLSRFFQSMELFNTVQPIGSIYEKKFSDNRFGRPTSKSDGLVEFICFCLNPNHFHFILKQVIDGGISEFMKRLGGGYTKYFNERNKRTGALFQGRFKSIHVDSNDYLLHLSAYVNLNNRVHRFGRPTPKLTKSSWDEYNGRSNGGFCEKDIILDQFGGINEYKIYAESSLEDILQRRAIVDVEEEGILEYLLE